MKDTNPSTGLQPYYAVKICGLARIEDAIYASYRGADLLGIVMHPPSPRCCTIEIAREIGQILFFKPRVLVFGKDDFDYIERVSDQLLDPLTSIQLPASAAAFEPVVKKYGPARVFPVYSISDDFDSGVIDSFKEHPWVVLDTGGIKDQSGQELDGGTGKTFDWSLLTYSGQRIFLAGGITPENAREAAEQGTYAIDICSGIESTPGKKCHEKMRRLFDNIKHVRR